MLDTISGIPRTLTNFYTKHLMATIFPGYAHQTTRFKESGQFLHQDQSIAEDNNQILNLVDLVNGYQNDSKAEEIVVLEKKDILAAQCEQASQKEVVPSIQQQIQVTKIDRIMRSKGAQIKYPFLILPSRSKLKLLWDSIILVMVFWITIFLPWQVAFPNEQLPIVDILILISFILDILITCRTTYFNEDNEEIVNPQQILKNYVTSGSFYIDVFSAFPMSEVYTGSNQNVIKILNLLKITRLLRLGRLLKLLGNENLKLYTLLFNYFILFVMLFHWLTCLWLMIVFLDTKLNDLDPQSTWLPINLRNIFDYYPESQHEAFTQFYTGHPPVIQYLYSYYSLIQVLLGSDIFPITVSQNYYLVFVGIIGSIATAALFAQISTVLQRIYHQSNKKDLIQDEIEVLMIKQKIPEELQEKALEYFEYCWGKKLIFDQTSSDLSDLSNSLQNECLILTHMDRLRGVPHFKCLREKETLAIIRALRLQIYMPGDIIASEGEVAQEMYFVLEGRVEVKGWDQGSVILKSGAHYGEFCLSATIRRSEELTAVGFCTLNILRKSDFLRLLSEFPDLKAQIEIGLKQERRDNKEQLIENLKNETLLCYVEDIGALLDEYVHDVFCPEGETILVPEHEISNLYIIFHGLVEYCQPPDSQFPQIIYLKQRMAAWQNFTDLDEELHYNKKTALVQYKKLSQFLKLEGQLSKYNIFGYFNPDQDTIVTSRYYFVCHTECHLGVLSRKSLELMKQKNVEMYQQLLTNFNDVKNLVGDCEFGSNMNQATKIIFDTYLIPKELYLVSDTSILQKKANEKVENLIQNFMLQDKQINRLQLLLEKKSFAKLDNRLIRKPNQYFLQPIEHQ